jgi:hypothetical protein
LRYELIDIFKSNGMKTPRVNKDDSSGEWKLLIVIQFVVENNLKLL